MNRTAITPYLFFSGRCDEALAFYQKELGANVEAIMRFNQSPAPAPEGMLQAGFENKVMHASFQIGGVRIMCSDGCNDQGKMEGFKLALAAPTEEVAHQYFNALAAEGKIEMPLTKTFWSPCYGMLTDKFGVEWMVMLYQDVG